MPRILIPSSIWWFTMLRGVDRTGCGVSDSLCRPLSCFLTFRDFSPRSVFTGLSGHLYARRPNISERAVSNGDLIRARSTQRPV
ncbi:hypothetical protein FA95DRAFT_268671 [Auriscalpium vulgare]|uniref:Uncharacterized protein n=1 Tax=Auriscalpium vulgare TaxID=40419 RepID=A0ACB8S6K0_9AGAM|nr:hypothetical protein FA95DRAFT_268671 [Auriscalpium vulgare]